VSLRDDSDYELADRDSRQPVKVPRGDQRAKLYWKSGARFFSVYLYDCVFIRGDLLVELRAFFWLFSTHPLLAPPVSSEIPVIHVHTRLNLQ
jgi:hypothetical protein